MSEENHYTFSKGAVPLARYIFSFLHDTSGNKKDLDPIFNVENINIPVEKYIERLVQYMQINDAGIVSVMVYLDIIKNNYNVNHNTIHKLLGGLFLLYIKMYYDDFYSNVHYSSVIGVHNNIVNQLEILCLGMLDWKLYIDRGLYNEAEAKLNFNKNFITNFD